MTTEFRVRRVVISMCGNLPDSRAITAAARLATQLGAEMSGLLLEDDMTATVRGLPFAREYAPASNRWLNLDKDYLGTEQERTRKLARRLMDDAAGHTGLTCSLEFGTGPLESALAHANQSDVLALIAPGRAGELMMLPFSELVRSVLELQTHALILPPRGIRAGGPILTLAETAQDNSIGIAEFLARAYEVTLVVLASSDCIVEIDAQFKGSATRVLPLAMSKLDQIEVTVAGLKPGILITTRPLANKIGKAFWFRLATNYSVATLMLDG